MSDASQITITHPNPSVEHIIQKIEDVAGSAIMQGMSLASVSVDDLTWNRLWHEMRFMQSPRFHDRSINGSWVIEFDTKASYVPVIITKAAA